MNPRFALAPVLAALLALAGCGPAAAPPPPASHATAPTATPPAPQSTPDSGSGQLERAHRDRLSHVWIEGAGVVTRLLRDDTKRPRHQRFVVRVGDGPDAFTVLIAHNIDLAPRVPFRKGDAIRFRGEYIWNDQGGVVHWTHRDPRGGRNSGGWIRWRDFVYR